MNTKEVARFQQKLKKWGREHFRSFPWRNTNDPYKILMAELMLHRTQASQVARVYEYVLERYPDIQSLALATSIELHDILCPLGLHWRIGLILDMARYVIQRFGSNIPQDKADLLCLPGVSDYIASSVRCFAWNMVEPLIDTNTVRVIGRLSDIDIKDSSRRNSEFRQLVSQLVDQTEPRIYNYALLDLADEVCTKRNLPKCSQCPVDSFCLYRDKSKESDIREVGKVS